MSFNIFRVIFILNIVLFNSCDDQSLILNPPDESNAGYIQESFTINYQDSEFSTTSSYVNQGMSPLLSIGKINNDENKDEINFPDNLHIRHPDYGRPNSTGLRKDYRFRNR